MTSEWPLRYLVAECITMCAPSSMGRVRTGVAEVESTATVAARFAGNLGCGGDVGDVPGGIRRRFYPDQARTGRARLLGEIIDRRVLVELDCEAPRRGI